MARKVLSHSCVLVIVGLGFLSGCQKRAPQALRPPRASCEIERAPAVVARVSAKQTDFDWLIAIGFDKVSLSTGRPRSLIEMGKVRFEFASGDALELCVSDMSVLIERGRVDSIVVHARHGSAEFIDGWLKHNQAIFRPSFQDNLQTWKADVQKGKLNPPSWPVFSQWVGGVFVEVGIGYGTASYALTLTMKPGE